MSKKKDKLTQRERKTLKKRRDVGFATYYTTNTAIRKNKPYGLKAIQRALWRHPDTFCLLCGIELSWCFVLGHYEPAECSEAIYHKLASGKRADKHQGSTGGPSS